MSTTILIVLGIAVLALIIGVILAAGGDGPKVTQIDRTTRKDDSEGDKR